MLKPARVLPCLHPVAQTAPQARNPGRCSQWPAIERRSLEPEKPPRWPAIAQPVRRLLSLRRLSRMCVGHYRTDASAAHHPFVESRAADPDLLRSAPAIMGSRCRDVSIAILLVKADCEFRLAHHGYPSGEALVHFAAAFAVWPAQRNQRSIRCDVPAYVWGCLTFHSTGPSVGAACGSTRPVWCLVVSAGSK